MGCCQGRWWRGRIDSYLGVEPLRGSGKHYDECLRRRSNFDIHLHCYPQQHPDYYKYAHADFYKYNRTVKYFYKYKYKYIHQYVYKHGAYKYIYKYQDEYADTNKHVYQYAYQYSNHQWGSVYDCNGFIRQLRNYNRLAVCRDELHDRVWNEQGYGGWN